MKTFKQMLSEAQFHGSKRLIEPKYRYVWALALILFFWASQSIICATISRFIENPSYLVITEIAEDVIKFPSVVVCPEIEYREYKIDEFLENLEYLPAINKSYVKHKIRQLAAFHSPDISYTDEDLTKIEILLKHNNMDVNFASAKLIATCEETILRCRLFGELVNCSKLFKMELTNYGFCCIFNGRSLKREIQKDGIQRTKPPSPIYTHRDGHTSGLMFAVNNSEKLDSIIDLSYIWIYLENSLEFAEIGGNGTAISPGTEFWFSYDSLRLRIDEDAKNLSPKLRHCRLFSEKLKYFPNYARRYCLMECQMQRTMDLCNCVRVTHYRPSGWNYCEARSLTCMKNSAVTYNTRVCDCPPTCDSKNGFVSVQTFPLTLGNSAIDPFYDDLELSKVTVVRAFIRIHNTKVRSRQAYYTSEMLFSQIGGTWNVFFGCSILTALELVQLVWAAIRQCKAKLTHRNPTRLTRELSLVPEDVQS